MRTTHSERRVQLWGRCMAEGRQITIGTEQGETTAIGTGVKTDADDIMVRSLVGSDGITTSG